MPRMKLSRLLALALLLGWACGARAQAMGQAQWAAQVRSAMPAALCKAGTYFRECFAQSAQSCRAAAQGAVDTCLKRYESQMPPVFGKPEDGGRWGQVIAACAGTAFETSSRGSKRDTARCNDPKAWR